MLSACRCPPVAFSRLYHGSREKTIDHFRLLQVSVHPVGLSQGHGFLGAGLSRIPFPRVGNFVESSVSQVGGHSCQLI